MKSIFKLLGIFCVVAFAHQSYALHFDYDSTDNNASILIRDVTLISRHWGENDEIGLLTPSGLCAGGAVVTGFPLGLPAWGDDAITDSVDGFRANELIRFVGWDASEQEEFLISEFHPIEGDTVWHSDGLMVCELADTGRHFKPSPTFSRHRILCTAAGIHTDFEVVSLGDFDEIGVFTPDSMLAGMMVWDSAAHQAVGYLFADDLATNNRREGFRAGESFRFVFWMNHRQREVEPNQVRFTRGDTTFAVGGASTVELEYFSSAVDPELNHPDGFRISGPYPNPFNGRGTISVTLMHEGELRYSVIDLTGRQMSPEYVTRFAKGEHKISVDFSNLSAGTYFCRINSGNQHRDLRFVLVK